MLTTTDLREVHCMARLTLRKRGGVFWARGGCQPSNAAISLVKPLYHPPLTSY